MSASLKRHLLEPDPGTDPGTVCAASRDAVGEPPALARLGDASTLGPEGAEGIGPAEREAPVEPAAAEPEDPVDSIVETSGESTLLGRYVVQGTLGRGAMGTVLRGFDPKLNRRVAIKVLHRGRTQRRTQRLMREAQALARLSHPNVVQVYEVGERQGMPFVVMELVQGRTLAQWLRATPRPSWRRCVEVFVQAGEGLAAAHEDGLVHRDFKPSNVIVDERGRVRVLDFGLARRMEGAGPPTPGSVDEGYAEPNVLGTPLTRKGGVVGTPAYMSPEQMFGQTVDARSDQFSFCVALYEAVYAQPPFEGDLVSERVAAILRGRIRPAPKGTTVPQVLRKTLLRGLARRPDARWPSMGSLLVELRRLLRPRSRRWIGVSAGIGLVAFGAGQLYRAEVEQRCGGAQAQLRGIWDDDRQRKVEAALLGTGRPHAAGSWARIEPRLGDYAATWIEQYTDACEATAVRREQSEEVMELRMSCLRRRRAALEATVNVLTEAEAMGQAVPLVVDLPRVADCARVERLVDRQRRVPLPEQPSLAQGVAELRDQLEGIRAERKAARYDRALKLLSPVIEQVETLGYRPLRAEVELERGTVEQRRGHYAEAEQWLGEAYTLALESGHDEVTVKAAIALAYLVGHLQSRPTEGLLWIRTALPLAERSRDKALLSHAIDIEGSVLETQGVLIRAEVRYRRALEIREVAADGDDLAVAHSASHLGHVLSRQGKMEQAEALLRRGLRIREAMLGEAHPDVANSLSGLAGVLFGQGKLEAAEALTRRVLRIREDALGPEHPQVAASVTNLGTLLMFQDKLEQAEVQHQRAVQIQEHALGAEHPDLAMSLTNLAGVLVRQGKLEQAAAHLERALAIQQTVRDGDHPQIALILSNQGMVRARQGKLEQAEARFERALEIQQRLWTEDHPDRARSMHNLGSVWLRQGKLVESQQMFERGLQMRERILGDDHPDVVMSLVGLTKTAFARGQWDNARAYAERALSIEAASTMLGELASVRLILARVLEASADRLARTRAHALDEQARADWNPTEVGPDQTLAQLESWRAEHPAPQPLE
ncbi:MAG: serine/threonine-protein kinase [Myxococcota bacterium]